MSAQGPFLLKRSVTLAGHRTSVALEPAFWTEIEKTAERKQQSVAGLIAAVDRGRHQEQSLASALRVFVLNELLGQQNAKP